MGVRYRDDRPHHAKETPSKDVRNIEEPYDDLRHRRRDTATHLDKSFVETWGLGTGATEHITSKKTHLRKFKMLRNPTMTFVTGGNSMEEIGYEELVFELTQPEGGGRELTVK